MESRSENARSARMRKRHASAVIREDLALELFAAGRTWGEISERMRETYGGSFDPRNCRRIVERGLRRRADQESPSVAEARARITVHLEALLYAHMPYATGEETPDGIPDVRSGDLVLKVLSKLGEVTGAVAPQAIQQINQTNVGIMINTPEDADAARARILKGLQEERQKTLIVDGQLASVGTSMGEITAGEITDGAPPPVITQETA